MDNKTKIIIIFPPVLIIILIFMAYSIPFEEKISESERQILEFTPSDIKIKKREVIHVKRLLKSPIDFKISGAGDLSSSTSENDLVSKIGYNGNTLSLIVISSKSRMAIIKGFVVKEGDSIEGMKVAKIEPQRVLLKNKALKWIYLENVNQGQIITRQMPEGQIK